MAGVDTGNPTVKKGNRILCTILMSMEVAMRIRQARGKLGLSQAQAAEQWGIPKSTLIKWERGDRTPRGLSRRALDQLLNQILRGEGGGGSTS